jgi:hypothetical protein
MSATTNGIKFLYQFSLGEYDVNNPGTNVVSVTSTAAGDHNKVNLTTTPLRETWRSGSIATFQEIIIKANDTSAAPDCFAILNHNFSNLAVIQLQGSMTADFSAPAFTIPFVWTKQNLVLLQNVGIAYNYYRFRVLDPTNACGYLEIGRIIAGQSFTFTNNEDISDSIQSQKQDLAYKTKTEGYFRAFNERVKVDKLTLQFPQLTTIAGQNSNYLGLLDLMETVGETYPFLTIVDPADLNFKLVWGVIETLPSISYGVNRYSDLTIPITEVF